MFLRAASLLYPGLPDRFFVATLRYLEIPSDDARAALARRLMQSKGYLADSSPSAPAAGPSGAPTQPH